MNDDGWVNPVGLSLAEIAQKGMTISQYRESLPIYKRRREILYLLETRQVIIVIGHTGCGKTTQIPQFLHEVGWTNETKMIACTQVSLYRGIFFLSVSAKKDYCNKCREQSSRGGRL